MNKLFKIIKYEFYEVLRSRWIIAYFLFFLSFTFLFFHFTNDISKATISLMNIVLLVIPLVSIILGTMYYYNSREFLEVLLAQPVDRKSVFLGKFIGLSFSLCIGFITGVGLPILTKITKTRPELNSIFILIICGVFLTFIFVALSFFIGTVFEDKVKGLGIAILIWLYLAIIYDGIILLVIFLFSDYPLEKATIVFSLLNPLDLARILVILKLDISALLGYTGAVFQKFFGSGLGFGISFLSLIVWVAVPFLAGLFFFNKKDF